MVNVGDLWIETYSNWIVVALFLHADEKHSSDLFNSASGHFFIVYLFCNSDFERLCNHGINNRNRD